MRAVVVGSGFGGLAGAIRLAAAGHDVTVLEQGDRVGGRAAQHVVDGFRFDGGPTVLTAPFMFEELFALAGERMADHVQLVALDPFYRCFAADGRVLDYRADHAEMRAAVTALSPADAGGYDQLGRRISAIFDAFYPYTERSMMQPQVMLAMLPYLLQHRAMLDVQRLVDGCVRDPFLRQALSFHPLLIGGHPARTPALYGLIMEFERRWGVHCAVGGTGALVEALAGLLTRLGGQVVTGARAERIVVRGGRAVGVRLVDGSVHPAEVVLSNADPGFTYDTLLAEDGRAGAARARLRLARPSMSLHVLSFGADRSWPDSPLLHHNLLFPVEQARELQRVFGPRLARPPAVRTAGPVPPHPFMYVHVPTRTDPSMAPPGCTALYVLVAAPARDAEVDAEQEHAEVRTRVLDVLEASYLPGLREHLVAERAIGPQHFRDTLHTPHGAAFSLQPTLLQSGWFRPHNRSRAVPNVYLVGAGTHPGAGVPAVLASGRIASDLVAACAGVTAATAAGSGVRG
ncbi:MAG TPA: phytoene desaturase family protein [Candidatus Nanopelagicales bacterium]